MALFGGGSVDVQSVQRDYAQIFITDEMVLAAFRSVRDIAVLTSKRLMLIAAPNVISRKTQIQSIPWRSVTRYTVETPGSLDDDMTLTVSVSGGGSPLELRVARDAGSALVQRLFATYSLNPGV